MRTIVHVGIHKTATTFLQRQFFPALGGIDYYDLRTRHRPFLHYVLHADDLDFDPARGRRLLGLGSPLPFDRQAVVFSDEQFYGSPWEACVTRTRSVRRLLAICPDLEIVIVLRSQEPLLQSLFLQYVKTGGSAHWREFLRSSRHPLVFSDCYFQFGQYVGFLVNTLGEDRVHVLFYEDMQASAGVFLNHWCSILGVPKSSWPRGILQKKHNLSICPRMVPLYRFVNHFVSSPRQPHLLLPQVLYPVCARLLSLLGRAIPQKLQDRAIPQAEADRFLSRCRESNRLLETIVGRNLAELGYACGDNSEYRPPEHATDVFCTS